MEPPQLNLQEDAEDEFDDHYGLSGLDAKRRDTLSIPYSAHRGSVGSNFMGGQLSSSTSQHSALSTAVLDEHEKSMMSLAGRRTDKVVRIASWLSNVSRREPTAGELLEDESEVLESRNFPPGYRNSRTFSGCDLKATSSQARQEYIHDMLTTDDEGNKMVITPSNKGRYQPQDSNDSALVKIGFSELASFNDPESIAGHSTASELSLNTLKSQKQFAASKLQRASYLSKVSTVQGQRSMVPEYETAPTVVTTNSDTDICSEVTGYTAYTTKSKGESQKETRQLSAQGAVRLLAGLKKWRGKPDTKLGRYGRIGSIAKDEGHHKYIQNNIQTIAVEMPIPLKKLMIEEVHGILKDTAKGYEKELGKKDPMTLVAMEKLEEVELLVTQFDSI